MTRILPRGQRLFCVRKVVIPELDFASLNTPKKFLIRLLKSEGQISQLLWKMLQFCLKCDHSRLYHFSNCFSYQTFCSQFGKKFCKKFTTGLVLSSFTPRKFSKWIIQILHLHECDIHWWELVVSVDEGPYPGVEGVGHDLQSRPDAPDNQVGVVALTFLRTHPHHSPKEHQKYNHHWRGGHWGHIFSDTFWWSLKCETFSVTCVRGHATATAQRPPWVCLHRELILFSTLVRFHFFLL